TPPRAPPPPPPHPHNAAPGPPAPRRSDSSCDPLPNEAIPRGVPCVRHATRRLTSEDGGKESERQEDRQDDGAPRDRHRRHTLGGETPRLSQARGDHASCER